MAELLRDRFPEDEVQLFSVATATGGRGLRHAQDSARDPIPHRVAVSPCIGCNRCVKGEGCFMHDDMDDLLEVLAAAREFYVVCPVFFAGPPAQMKAVLDRVQPLFFTDVRKRPKRPAHLLVVGGGGDPHGFEPHHALGPVGGGISLGWGRGIDWGRPARCANPCRSLACFCWLTVRRLA